MNTAIDVKQLSVTLGNRHILHDINVSVPIGKITTLIGPNGCGKSTLLRSMIGYIHSPRECVTILGKPLQSYSNKLTYLKVLLKIILHFLITLYLMMKW